MAKLFALVLIALAAAIASAQTGSTCQFTQEAIQASVMECIAHEPALLFQVIEHMKNPQSMATMSFICDNQKAVVDMVMCLENKYASCFPSVKDMITQYLPNHERWSDSVNFMCVHKTDLLENNCMDQSQVQEFMQCYMGKLGGIMQTARVNHDLKASVCSIIHSEEQCIKTYHGTCTQNYVDLLIQLLEKLFPSCPAQTVDVNDQAMNVLLHGQPLMFQPKGGVEYKVVDG